MMEQGSLADLLTLAKSGDDNKLGEMMAMMNPYAGSCYWYSGTGYGQSVPEPAGFL